MRVRGKAWIGSIGILHRDPLVCELAVYPRHALCLCPLSFGLSLGANILIIGN